jgi:hypothetical protein
MAEWTGRIVWWRHHHVVSSQGASPARPFEAVDGWREHFAGRDALEIGPGEGRQAAALMPLCRSYTVVDIVPEVLALPIYAGVERRQIRSFSADRLGRRFGVISFWYLIHHVRSDELDDFVGFVAAHAEDGASVFFNIPGPSPSPTLLADALGDGRKTTPHDPHRVRAAMRVAGFVPVAEVVQDFSSHVMLWRRR